MLPNAELCLGGLPDAIEAQAGVVLLLDQISDGDELINLLRGLETLGVEAPRLRVITALAASPGLKQIGESYPEITIHTACIDADLDEQGRILPGIGNPLQRLGIRTA